MMPGLPPTSPPHGIDAGEDAATLPTLLNYVIRQALGDKIRNDHRIGIKTIRPCILSIMARKQLAISVPPRKR